VIPEIETQIGVNLTRIVADRGYRGHNAPPDHKFRVYISGQRRRLTLTIKRELRRRSAIEPVIGHAKAEQRMGRTISPGPTATPPTPSSPPPATTSAGSSNGWPTFGASCHGDPHRRLGRSHPSQDCP
jgi:transposase, IS5 family